MDDVKRTRYFIKIFLITLISLMFIESTFKVIAFKSLFGLELIRILLFSISASLIVSFISTLFKKVICKTIITIFIFLVGFYSMLQLTFYNLLNNYMSLNASSGGGLARVTSQIPQFIKSIKLEYLLLLLPFIAVLIIFIFCKKFIVYEKYNIPTKIFLLFLIVLSEVHSFVAIGLFEDKNQIRSNKDLYRAPTLLNLSLKQFGTLKFFERDLLYMLFPKDTYTLKFDDIREVKSVEDETELDYERKIDDTEFIKLAENETNADIKQLHQYFLNQPITPKNDYTGHFKGKNVVVIMVEAFDMIAINEELTPTLYMMSKEGWYFDHYYTPKYSCTTGESEFISETSIIPSSTVCTPNTYADNNYSTSIFSIFRNNGYYTSSYHSWKDEFYSRSKYHINMGSNLYLDFDSLNMSAVNGWPLDTEMFANSYEYYSDKEPFFTYIITSSTHFPYDYDTTVTQKHWDKVKNTSYPEYVKRYLAKAIELDDSIKLLMDKLKQDDKLDNTVFVIFGDHHPLKMSLQYLNDYSDIDRFEDFNIDRLPFIIYNSAEESKVISKTTSTFDILPTVANLFGLDYDPRYYIGLDAFSKEEGVVIFTNGSWITDTALYDSTTNTYKFFNGSMDQEYIEKINKKVNDKFYVSNKILTLDYFKYRFNAQ